MNLAPAFHKSGVMRETSVASVVSLICFRAAGIGLRIVRERMDVVNDQYARSGDCPTSLTVWFELL